ncbi:cryptochrome/photolyase family protein [Sagittula salina]|uniref:Deoxyribodipyrimidine photo-lyase n=1 Tax=Sagittula salina TaxID=2820268 RepID=A0A940MM23_9RHOB|nr:deoxyribodipyrimidine photo-lyase [Sagittula salina]MBP0481839.1 deoxyribodipyrimidine photo-lyase [Sagittula salina]
MSESAVKPTIVWIRRDLRLTDHAALVAASERGGPVIPVFIRDGGVDALGAAPKWRLGLGLEYYAEVLAGLGSGLVLRSGPAREVLEDLVGETGAEAVYWMRAYDPDSVERDRRVKEALTASGVVAESFAGHVMFEPWTVETQQGQFYKVYTPFWKAVKGRTVPVPRPAPRALRAPPLWPAGERLTDWHLGDAMRRGAAVVRPYVRLGEAAAQARLAVFMRDKVDDYAQARDRVAEDGTSGLSENLSLGEISPAECWHAGLRAMQAGKAGAETFLKELVWREFAYHLMWHTPRLLTDNWRPEWDGFGWNSDERRAEVRAWKQGRTGVPFVDAGMRELYVTGRMHNRVRMVVASYLTKHLLGHWQIGQAWFEDCLIDWDPASNALGWQWSAGSGPDATPYFRVFNPVTQRERFDRHCVYVNRWIAEGRTRPSQEALSYFDAVPENWRLSPGDAYPRPVVDVKEGRARALEAYAMRAF